jgi:hypothetical protein
MGHRTVKRVALDFEWPLHKVWEGYLNPDRADVECVDCGGSGYGPAARMIAETFYGYEHQELGWHDKITQDEVQALVDEGRLMDFTHTWSPDDGWQRRPDGYVPTAAEVNEDQHKHPGRMLGGHDAINRHILIKARCKRLGIACDCPACGGHGVISNPDEAECARAKAWLEREPPAGPGWQLWETTSEGSPISPVCATAENLAAWCATGATIFGKEKLSDEQWLAMFRAENPEDAVDIGSFLIVENGQMRIGLHKLVEDEKR